MRLSYRGAHIESVPQTLELTEGEIRAGRPQAAWSCQTVPTDRAKPVQRGEQRPQSMARPTTLSLLPEVDRLHRDNLRRNIERRLQAAQARGDRALVHALQTEFDQVLYSA